MADSADDSDNPQKKSVGYIWKSALYCLLDIDLLRIESELQVLAYNQRFFDQEYMQPTGVITDVFTTEAAIVAPDF
ncbi:MAG: hypothetical protein CTY19_01490 [Methylomonas sp.]|nr:MAG: hypothetical protein CTY19_01490 [Methylomonas sp.]